MKTSTWLSIVAAIGMALVSTQASAQTTFGARLTVKTQPSNAGKGIYCNITASHPTCSYVLAQAYQCEFGSCKKGHLAPKTGTLSSVSLIACYPGSFVLQIAHVDSATQEVQVKSTGPLINYAGDSRHCRAQKFDIETFPVSVAVKKNDYLAVAPVSPRLGFVRCSGGSNNTLLFTPPLPDGGPLRAKDGGDGCFMLLEAQYAS